MKKLLCTVIFAIILIINVYALNDDSTRTVPILMYHSVDNTGGDFSVSESKLEYDIHSLKADGYTFVSFDDLRNFVYNDGFLPEKCVVITFDDGYENNYTGLYPIAQKHGIKFEIFGVVAFISYTENAFNWTQANEMISSGLGGIRCHTFGMHDDDNGTNYGIIRKKDADFRTWEGILRHDLALAHWLTCENLGKSPDTFAYPFGAFSAEAEQILRETGYNITVTTEPGVNIIRKNDPESLHLLMRISMDGEIIPANLKIQRFSSITTTPEIDACRSLIWQNTYVSRRQAFRTLYEDKINSNYQNSRATDLFFDCKYMDEDWSRTLSWGIERGFIKGYEDYTLRPLNYLTRGEFAIMLSRYMGFDGTFDESISFTDSSDWNRAELSWCAEKGYMVGYGDGTFGANDFLTEKQINLICTRIK